MINLENHYLEDQLIKEKREGVFKDQVIQQLKIELEDKENLK